VRPSIVLQRARKEIGGVEWGAGGGVVREWGVSDGGGHRGGGRREAIITLTKGRKSTQLSALRKRRKGIQEKGERLSRWGRARGREVQHLHALQRKIPPHLGLKLTKGGPQDKSRGGGVEGLVSNNRGAGFPKEKENLLEILLFLRFEALMSFFSTRQKAR